MKKRMSTLALGVVGACTQVSAPASPASGAQVSAPASPASGARVSAPASPASGAQVPAPASPGNGAESSAPAASSSVIPARTIGHSPGGTSPCAVVLCARAARCVVQPDGSPKCVEQSRTATPCVATGCSASVCSDRPLMTTCEFKPEYECYRTATCERDASTGRCGWRQTLELQACLAAHRR